MRIWMALMILLILLLYFVSCIYYFAKKLKWVEKNVILFQSKLFRNILYGTCIFLTVLVVLVNLLPHGTYRIYLLKLEDYWLGVFLYLMLFLLIADLLTLLLHCLDKKFPILAINREKMSTFTGITVLLITLVFCLYGFLHGNQIQTNTYEVTVDKQVEEISTLTIVLVSDLHLGYYTKSSHLVEMVNQINALEPDVVIIAGDIFNNDYDQIEDPDQMIEILNCIESVYGVYAVYGNHDVTEVLIGGFPVFDHKIYLRDPRMNQFLKAANITALSDQVTTIANDSIYLVGRLDESRPGDGTNQRKSMFTLLQELDHSKPIIVIDHQPTQLDEASINGADLLLSGHTHAGQFFPLIYFQRFKWKNYYGCRKVGNMYSFVTAGIGAYTPNMRVMTTAEVMQIKVHFTN